MEILINALIRATGWSIIHSLWQGATLYTLLLLLFLFNPKLSAKTRHNLSFMALAGIFLWFVQTFYSEFTKWLELGRSIEAFTLSGMAAHYSGTIAEIPTSLLFDRTEKSIPFIVFIYSVGLILQCIFLLMGYLRVLQIRTKGLTDLKPDLNSRFRHLSSKLGIERGIRFAQSSLVSVPLVIGYFKPMVLLPLSVLTQFTPQQLEAIIIHELSHIRRNDYLLNILKISIETILFFNPFVWLSGKLIDTERENACDDLVLNITGSPLSYAMTLLELEKLKQNKEIFSMAITGKKYYLLNRIKRITNMKTSNLNLKIQLFAILIAVMGVFSLAFIPAKEKSKDVEAEKTTFSKKRTLTFVLEPDVNLYDKTDTTRKKIKIVIEDEKGNKKEYKSLAEMPADVRLEFMKENGKGFSPFIFSTDTAFLKSMKNFNVKFDTGYFKAIKNFKIDTAKFFNGYTITEKFAKLDSSLWKTTKNMFYTRDSAMSVYLKSSKNLKGVRVDMDGNIMPLDSTAFNYTFKALKNMKMDSLGAVTLWGNPKFMFNSKDLINSIPKLTPEQMESLKNQFDSPEWKKNMGELQKQLNSPEYRQKMQDIQENLKELQKQLQSPEFQKKLKEMSPEEIKKMNKDMNKFGLMAYPNLSVAGLSSNKTSSGNGPTTASVIAANPDKTFSVGTYRDSRGDTRVILRTDRDSRSGLTVADPSTTYSLMYGTTPADLATISTTGRSGRTIASAKSADIASKLTTAKPVNGDENFTMTFKPYSPNDPARREAIKKILETPEGKERIKKILNSNSKGYLTKPDGKLEIDYNLTFILPEGAVSQRDIIDYFPKATLKNEFNFTPETQQQIVKRILEDPANKAKLNEIYNKNWNPTGRGTYIFPDGSMIQQSDIDNYYKKQDAPKTDKPAVNQLNKANTISNSEKLFGTISESAMRNYPKTLHINAKTDTVKFDLVDATSKHKNKGIFVVNNKVYTGKELTDLVAKSGHLEMIIPKPIIGIYTKNDNNAIKQWGERAKNGVTFIQPAKKS